MVLHQMSTHQVTIACTFDADGRSWSVGQIHCAKWWPCHSWNWESRSDRIIDGNAALSGFSKKRGVISVKFPHAIYCTLREPGTLKSSKCSFQDVWSSAQVRDSCKYAFFKGSWGDWHHQLVVGLHFENMNLSLGNELGNTKNRLPGSTGAKFQA